MNWLTRIHGRKTPPGLEVQILRRLPRVTLFSALTIFALPIIARWWPLQPGIDAAKHIKSVEIFAIAVGITLITAIVTVAIGCIVVHIMKGPAYAADSLPVSHADKPKPLPQQTKPPADIR